MTQAGATRRFAAWLLKLCRRISPPPVRDWGDAMLVELEFVEGNWPALAWAAGGASVLMRRSLIHLVTGRSRESAQFDSSRTGGPMRKLTPGLAIAGILIFCALFVAPSFRQALEVSFTGWRIAFRQPVTSERTLGRLAAQARASHDAETMAFVALKMPPGAESDELARQAVQLDSRLTWIYADLAVRSMWREKSNPQVVARIAKLESWDQGNAFPHLLEAQNVAWGHHVPPDYPKLLDAPRFTGPMAAAFASNRYDSYLANHLDLFRKVTARHHFGNPMDALLELSSHPIPNLSMIRQYAMSVMAGRTGNGKETGSTRSSAKESEALWSVAQFGQAMVHGSQTDIERLIGSAIEREAYKRLLAMPEKTGDTHLRTLLTYQTESLNPRRLVPPDRYLLVGANLWNAEVGSLSLLILLVSASLLSAGGLFLIARRPRHPPTRTRFDQWPFAVALAGALGLVISAPALYLSYRPYASLYSGFARASRGAGPELLASFRNFMGFPYAVRTAVEHGLGWAGLLVLAACLLVIEIYRVFSSRGPARETV